MTIRAVRVAERTRYDFTEVAAGDGVRVGAQMFRVLGVGRGSKEADLGAFVHYVTFALEGVCAECGKVWSQRFTSLARGATVRQRCDVCRAAGRMWRGADNASRTVKRDEAGGRAKPVRRKRVEAVIYDPPELEGRTEGEFVRYRGRDYQIARVSGIVRRNGSIHDRLDVVGTCAVCGGTFPHACHDDDSRLPLRCRRCRDVTGRTWRYEG